VPTCTKCRWGFHNTCTYVVLLIQILIKNLKIDMLRVVLDWQNIYKIVLDKAFFLILWRFYFFGFYVEKFEKKNGPSQR
jgi:hypothetical protein